MIIAHVSKMKPASAVIGKASVAEILPDKVTMRDIVTHFHLLCSVEPTLLTRSAMTRHQPFYDDGLAYIHVVGFRGFPNGSALRLLQLLRKAGIHDDLITDLDCGGGVWSKHLLDAGYRSSGVNVSSAMVASSSVRLSV